MLLNLLFKTSLKDIKSGFIVYKKEVLEDILKTRGNFYYFQNLITIAAIYKGYTLKQIPVKFSKRHSGNHSLSQFQLIL